MSLPKAWGPRSSTRNPAMMLDGMNRLRSNRIRARTVQPTAKITPRITNDKPIVCASVNQSIADHPFGVGCLTKFTLSA